MEFNIEIVGLIATLFVLASFLMSGEKNIRIINIVGALMFVVYGVLIGVLSVWLLNGLLFFIHIYKLYKLNQQNKHLKEINKLSTIFNFNNKQIQK